MTNLKITIITSTKDLASITIKNQLLKHYNFTKQQNISPWNKNVVKELHEYLFEDEGKANLIDFSLIVVNKAMIKLDEFLKPDEMFGDLLFFASRHQSKTNKPGLLCHTTGNLDKDNSAGGEPNKVSKGSGLVLYYFYRYLSKYSKVRNFNVAKDQEVNHHGPTNFNQAMTFIEQGSTKRDWLNKDGAKIIADTIIQTGKDLVEKHYKNGKWNSKKIKICIGFGGSHYMPSFSNLIKLGCSFVHTVPKYKAQALTGKMVSQLIERSNEKIDYFVIDWKGLKSIKKKHVLNVLRNFNIPIKKSKFLRKEMIKEKTKRIQ